ncbi:MAG: 3'(2'),5'-bisphosphate nucleotidase CysQ [Odoribacter sp.]|nr:3'(2'),5'-bisphosphate nucleotidase CysQ [Odoribacter sp.]
MDAALKAGKEILKIYNDPTRDFEVIIKSDYSPLTIADRNANKVIVEILNSTSFPILSEEIKNADYSERAAWKKLWIVDPLDGTKEFIKQNGEFTVNIALIEDGSPILGVIYVPVKKELYYGATNLGAFKAENIEEISDFNQLKLQSEPLPYKQTDRKYTIVASRSHMSEETENFIVELAQTYPDYECISCGSSIKICLIAEGKADIYPRFAPTMEWDTAAGHAIIKGIGKDVYHQDGKTPLTYNKENLLNPWFIVK